jgi:GxxExxY protein
MSLELEELTGQIIGCAIEVHRELGPGFLESIYESALIIALRQSGLKAEPQRTVPIFFHGEPVGEHRLDLLVENLVVVELKAVRALEDVHFAIVRSYLKACGLTHGLLLNFATMPLTVKRVIHTCENRNEVSPISSFPDFLSKEKSCH